ncbi:MAG: transketolase [Acidobacteria bacterium]|nr:MAG: transketolase [Acidobacteriota bacterium]PYU68648.1 MAG: transketolase [Acidobacteriota bacterium]
MQLDLDLLSINTIRTLAIDAVQQANSGHPGAPMGLAPVVYSLWQRFLRYDPADPTWPNRDRFVLSAGHASMLLYATLHLTGVRAVNAQGRVTNDPAVSMEEIKRFRQIDSRTPGHPESHLTTGVETTTGPLGQGAGNSVGMAIAGKWLAENFNRPGFDIFNFNVYAICGDGDLMEGVASEAASLAGHLKLSNLCWIYDNNRVTLDGPAEWSFSEDVMTRFKGYGWNVAQVTDANDLDLLARGYDNFLKSKDRPTLIVVDSHIGYGSPHKQDSYEAHGEPLGEAEVKLVKKNYGWPEDAKFLVPEGVYDQFKNGVGKRGAEARAAWNAKYEEYKKQFPQLADQLNKMQSGQLPDGWDKDLPSFPADPKGMATRESSGKTLNALAKKIPWLVGGSADLAKSNKTNLTFDGAGDFYPEQYRGRNVHFGVREHAMGAIVNGMTLSKLRAFSATFFNFSDYMRPSMRLGALMEIPAIYIFTHDSIGVGEDGPTHQPIEQLASLRAMPNMLTLRPGDANEVVEAYKVILQHTHGPSTLVLSRQAMPTLDRVKYAPAAGVAKGAYILVDAPGGKPDVILMGSGSEVSLCVEAGEKLNAAGIKARVVSMPSWELFERQDAAYKESVLPTSVSARVSVEMASTFGWERYVGLKGKMIGMHSFGASAPLKDLLRKFGMEADKVVAAARGVLGK